MFTNCICYETKKEFLMRFENIGEGAWELVEAKINSPNSFFGDTEIIRTFGNQKIGGEFTISPNYRGCPFCGQMTFFACGKCGQPHCNDGVVERNGKRVSVTCLKCGNTGEFGHAPMEEIAAAEDYTISGK